ncbi:MAG: NAD(P)H-hydrate dehydratase [Betaproteobacteria bacterium]|nr:NAD(P)H-hydrate dehydratase [Betaproteobacteria bacterium]
MIPILSVKSIRQIETEENTKRSVPLTMEAGARVAQFIQTNIKQHSKILVLVGPGSKGQDALCAVDILCLQPIHIWLLVNQNSTNLPNIQNRYRAKNNVKVIVSWITDDFDLIVDGVLGIGLNRALEEPYVSWIKQANCDKCLKFSIDIPTGLDADTGHAYPNSFKADITYSLISGKIGLYTNDGPDYSGKVTVDQLNLTINPEGYAYTRPFNSKPQTINQSTKNTHKGQFGDIGIIGGAAGMVGAGLLAAQAALYSGAGRVWLSLLDHQSEYLVPFHCPQLMTKGIEDLIQLSLNCLIAGPGSTAQNYSKELVQHIIQAPYPIILDAGFLDLLKDPYLEQGIAKRIAPTILTPHPGEASRILGKSIQSRLEAAREISNKYNAWTVLKGQGTIIHSPLNQWWINTTGNPALSIPGSGDVLCGVIASLVTRYNNVECGVLNAVHTHGQAGDDFQKTQGGTIGMTFSELITQIRIHLNKL